MICLDSGGQRSRSQQAIEAYLMKGNRVNISEPEHGDWIALGRFQCGNTNETRDVGAGPGKSFLFFVRDGHPGIGLAGDRVVVPVKHRASQKNLRKNPKFIIKVFPKYILSLS